MARGAADQDRDAQNREELRLICAKLNAQAEAMCRELLPNGRKEGKMWATSGIDDVHTGKYSLKVTLTGTHQGEWTDFGLSRGQRGYSGDILTLIKDRVCGGNMGDAIKWAKSKLGMTDMNRAQYEREYQAVQEKQEKAKAAEAADREKARKRAEWLWHGGVDLPGTPGEAYLKTRGIDFARLGGAPGALKYRPDAYSTEAAEKWGRDRAKLPAIVAGIYSLAGALIGVQRTYLDISGWDHARRTGSVIHMAKAGKLEEAKMSMGPSLGGYVPVHKGDSRRALKDIKPGTRIYLSEGIEDGLSVAIAKPDARVIAAAGLSRIGAVELPEQMGPLVLIGQNDPPDSQAAETFERAIAAQQARGRTVELMFPPPEYKDFNDYLLGKKRG